MTITPKKLSELKRRLAQVDSEIEEYLKDYGGNPMIVRVFEKYLETCDMLAEEERAIRKRKTREPAD